MLCKYKQVASFPVENEVVTQGHPSVPIHNGEAAICQLRSAVCFRTSRVGGPDSKARDRLNVPMWPLFDKSMGQFTAGLPGVADVSIL